MEATRTNNRDWIERHGHKDMTNNDSGIQTAAATKAHSVVDEGLKSDRMEHGKPDQSDDLLLQTMAKPVGNLESSLSGVINYQDDAELAAMAAPELISLLRDEDVVVCAQAAQMTHQLTKKQASLCVLAANHDLIDCTLDLLARHYETGLLHKSSGRSASLVKYTSGILHNLSHDPTGIRAIFNSGFNNRQQHGQQFDAIALLVGVLKLYPQAAQSGRVTQSVETVLFYNITTLHNLLLRCPAPHVHGAATCKDRARQASAVSALTGLLRHSNPKFLAIACDCLQRLCLSNERSKVELLRNGGCESLNHILGGTDDEGNRGPQPYEKLAWAAVRLLKVVSINDQCKRHIVQNTQCVQTLSGLLPQTIPPPNVAVHSRVLYNALWCLRNVSDVATNVAGLDHLLRALIVLLQSCSNSGSEVPTVHLVCGILSNLTCNNEHNKLVVTNANGVDSLMRTICDATERRWTNGSDGGGSRGASAHKQVEEIVELAASSLRHLTCRHLEDERARTEIRNWSKNFHPAGAPLQHNTSPARLNGLQMIVDLLLKPSTPPIIKAILGLLRNIALGQPENRAALRNCGVSSRVAEVLRHAASHLNRQSANDRFMPRDVVSPLTKCVDDIRLSDLVDYGIALLHVLSSSPPTCLEIANLQLAGTIIIAKVLPVFTIGPAPPPPSHPHQQAAYPPATYAQTESVVRHSLGLLSKMFDANSNALIYEISAVPSVMQTLSRVMHHYPNSSAAANASKLIFHLNQPQMQQQQPGGGGPMPPQVTPRSQSHMHAQQQHPHHMSHQSQQQQQQLPPQMSQQSYGGRLPAASLGQ